MPETLITPNPWMMLPFGVLLGMIALAPLWFADWWATHYPKVACALGGVTLGYYLFDLHAYSRVLAGAHEYLSFIALIGALFVVSGGIHISVKGEATPLVNVTFLLVGAVLANLLGTTGASMLLIRPWIRMNKYRITAHHIVFFIFIISNVGGCLTPIGDPPLFLGYLKGIPFWWVAEHCWPMWATGLGILLAMFFVVDSFNFRRAPKPIREKETAREEWRFDGLGNVFFLAVILGAVFIKRPIFLREALMVAAAVGSYYTTRKPVHEANHFNFHPILEVAILFLGIFATMMPALDWLRINAGEAGRSDARLFLLGQRRPLQRAGQRTDVFEFPERFDGRGAGYGYTASAGHPIHPFGSHQRGCGIFRREHLHRQRPEFHGQGHRRPTKGPHADILGLRFSIHTAVHGANVAGRLVAFFPLTAHWAKVGH